MKRSRLLNSELSYEIAKIGHTAHITLCDAGLPIPNGVKRIDLAVEAGLPSFISVLKPILSEMQVEEIVLAEEIFYFKLSIADCSIARPLRYLVMNVSKPSIPSFVGAIVSATLFLNTLVLKYSSRDKFSLLFI